MLADDRGTTARTPSVAPAWFDSLNLDPASPWLAMGTRSLGDEPWLVVDDRNEVELALRTDLIEQRVSEVVAWADSAAGATDEVICLVEAAGIAVEPVGQSLARLGRSITEDVVLLRRGDVEWEFEAGVVCFPSRWRLADKIGRPLREVHGPTPGYDTSSADRALAARVTSLMDRLNDHIVRRRNWFVHPDPALFQPDRPVDEPVVGHDRVLSDLYFRSERQTLRALPASGRVLFTIKTQQCSFGEAVADRERRRRVWRYLTEAPVDQIIHRGISEEQRRVLIDVLG